MILSAPSGAGKTTIARALEQRRSDVGYSISATTRSPRPGEQDGVDYHFLSAEEFGRRVAGGEFLEWAEYGGNRYGTLRSEVERLTGSGRHALLDIEVQGAAQVRSKWANVLSVFIIPPSAGDLLVRLGGRKTEHQAAVRARLEHALVELAEAPKYDFVVVNAELDHAVAAVSAIIDGRPSGMPREALHSQVSRLRDELAAELARSTP
ncbi:MAG: guanylate kinase [Gemmatimonadales bacterium]